MAGSLKKKPGMGMDSVVPKPNGKKALPGYKKKRLVKAPKKLKGY